MDTPQGEVTELLQRVSTGDQKAADQVLALVYDELRRVAGSFMRRERADHTLQATALVHEVWLRLLSEREWDVQNRGHFFAIATQAMRRVLIDYARAANAEKRGAAYRVIPLEDAVTMATEWPGKLLDVHRALERLEKLDERRARIAEMRVFAGLTIDEIADVCGVTARTVERQWRAARAWLSRELGDGPNGAAVAVS